MNEYCRFGHLILDDNYCLFGHVRPVEKIPESDEGDDVLGFTPQNEEGVL